MLRSATIPSKSMRLTPQKFNIEVVHNVVFVPKNEGLADKDINRHNIAAKEDLKVRNTDVLKTLWVVRWTTNGLMPVKPVADFERIAAPLAWQGTPLLDVGPSRARRG